MASLDDIWDTPVTTNSPKTPRHLDADDEDVEVQRPQKRQKQALFLSDSESEGGSGGRMRRGVVKAPPPRADGDMDDDVEALFADAENDEGLSFKRIGDLDVAAMEREAKERHRRALPLTPHPVMPSSSPPRDGMEGGADDNESKANDKDKGKGKDSKKRPRPIPLNENLLLGPTGFPNLISELKEFKVKGKGREAEDLARLMRVYNFWTHRLHPRLKYRDTVLRIEKLCHTKRMQVALSVWRDEAHGKTREVDADLSLDSDIEEANTTNTNSINRLASNATGPSTPLISGPETDHFSLPPSSRASSQPPTSDFPDDEELFGPSTSSTSRPGGTYTASTSVAAKKRMVIDDDDEEESFWKELEAARTLRPSQHSQQQQPKLQSAPMGSLDDLDDAEIWAALEETMNQPSVTSGRTISGVLHPTNAGADGMDIDDDDDMWDIIRENEKTAPATLPAAAGLASVASSSTSTSKQPCDANQSMAESEMDWDDMYAD